MHEHFRTCLNCYGSTCGVWQPLHVSQSVLTVDVACYNREGHYHTVVMAICSILVSSKMVIFQNLFICIIHFSRFIDNHICNISFLCCQLSDHGNISSVVRIANTAKRWQFLLAAVWMNMAFIPLSSAHMHYFSVLSAMIKFKIICRMSHVAFLNVNLHNTTYHHCSFT